MAKVLAIYNKATGALVSTGDENSVSITGLAAGTVVADGEYQVAYVEGDLVSDKVDLPGFTVALSAPKDTVVTATTDGAHVTAD